MKPFRYIDTVKTKKGKTRTWLGHLRALARIEGIPLKELMKRRGLSKSG